MDKLHDLVANLSPNEKADLTVLLATGRMPTVVIPDLRRLLLPALIGRDNHAAFEEYRIACANMYEKIKQVPARKYYVVLALRTRTVVYHLNITYRVLTKVTRMFPIEAYTESDLPYDLAEYKKRHLETYQTYLENEYDTMYVNNAPSNVCFLPENVMLYRKE